VKKPALIEFNPATRELICHGEWKLTNIVQLKTEFQHIVWPRNEEITVAGQTLTAMDSAGAWLLSDWLHRLTAKKLTFKLMNFSEQQEKLLTLITHQTAVKPTVHHRKKLSWISNLGKLTIDQMSGAFKFLDFIGQLALEALAIFRNPALIRWQAITSTVEKTGLQALPIIALLSFMIGVVISYQMGNQLRNYGANIFIVNLLGLSVLREFGPLLTAIMVAGRTGSAFTAQLGTMQVNQEIDALNTMGVTPQELLLLPRIIGLFIALPLLTMWADIFGVIGGMVMANNMLDISWYDFLRRFEQEIPVRAILIGLGKAPIFALIIASVGCFQGMQVKGSADSVGKQTTRSVVLSIFFIIVADAIFSIIFSKMGL
jgi:phospholipid/cholesterol/gamma-HCH transport system permease protein